MSEGKKKTVNFEEDTWFSVGVGLIYRVVCVPKSWDHERISDEVTKKDPPGTSFNRWVVSEPDDERDAPFNGVNEIPCPDCDGRKHVFMNC